MAYTTSVPFFATPSISISRAFSMNFEITTGWSEEISTARLRYLTSESLSSATLIAAPESTYDGRTKTGYPSFSAVCTAAASVVSSAHAGWSISSPSSSLEKTWRSSARIIVHHYRAVSLPLERLERLHPRPVEFHRGSYRVRAASEDRNLLFGSPDL